MILSTKTLQRTKSLHEQTYQALRESILSGTLAPGDRLIETQLAEQLQVSRTPIREAIRQLQREELVTSDDGGLRVVTISTTEAVHLYDCRIALETLAVTDACKQASSSQLQKLKEYVMQAEKLCEQHSSQLDSFKLLELDYQFHHLIAQSSGNNCLVSLLEQVFAKMALLRMQTTRHNPRVLEIRTEHYQIYEAIARRDIEAASQALQGHLHASKVRVVQELKNLQPNQKRSEASNRS